MQLAMLSVGERSRVVVVVASAGPPPPDSMNRPAAFGYFDKREKIICPGTSRCDRLTLREGLASLNCHVVHVIERCRTALKQRPEPRFAELPKCARTPRPRSPRPQKSGRFRRAERSTDHETSNELCELRLANRRHHDIADQVYIPGTSSNSGGTTCAPRKVGTTLPRPLARGGANSFERLQFRFEVETVARFGLDSRGPCRGISARRPIPSVSARFWLAFPTPSILEPNPSASRGDLFKLAPENPPLKIHQPRMSECRGSYANRPKPGRTTRPPQVDLNNRLSILLQPRIAQCVLRSATRRLLPPMQSTAAS